MSMWAGIRGRILKKMTVRNSFVTKIIVVFLICNVISVFLFATLITAKENSKVEENQKNNLKEIVNEKSQLISIMYQRVQNRTESIGTWYEMLLNSNYENSSADLSKSYSINSNGTITRNNNKQVDNVDESAIFIANTAKKDASLYKDISLSEQLDKPFAQAIKRENVTWIYLVTRSNILRCSPYSNLKKQFKANHDQRKDPFYTDATEKKNPEKTTVWTKPYVDYLRTGWTMTCSQPVYDRNGDFYGVICLDMSINKIKEKYLNDFSIGSNGIVYWLTKDGDVYFQSDAKDKASSQGEVLKRNIFEDSKMGTDEKQQFKKALAKGSGVYNFYDGNKQKLLFCASIKEADSVLVIEAEKDQFTAEDKYDPFTLVSIVLVDLLTCLIFLIWLNIKFSRPMQSLVDKAKKITKGDYSTINDDREDHSKVYEMAKLEDAFSAMNESIEGYTDTLKEKNREISTILETVEGVMMIVDPEGNILSKNRDTNGVNQEMIRKAIQQVSEDKHNFSEQVIVDREVYRNTYYPVCGADGILEKVVISSECITKSLLMEKEVQQMEKMAGIGQLSAAIVHELKNSLALIKGATYIIKLENSDQTNLKEAETISKAADEAENVIDTLLDYSRGEDSSHELIHIGTLIKQILLLSKKSMIIKNISTSLDIDDECYVDASSREALKVVLQNIIINAIQAVDDDGKIIVTSKRSADVVLISIKDDGPAIGEDIREKVFEPFFTTKESGNGIGLWISKRLVDSLGGTLTVSVDENSLTTFEIVLPA